METIERQGEKVNKREITQVVEWSETEIREAGLYPADIEHIVKLLVKLSASLQQGGLELYVTPGEAAICHSSRPHHAGRGEADQGSVIAWVGGPFDGGDW